jgi:6-phosphogluconate dehydrogenase
MGDVNATANIGVVGLAVMGSNLARNLASREGNTVAVYNRSFEKTETLLSEHPEAGFVGSKTVEEFAASLQTPRTAIIMVKAGAGTDAVIDQLTQVFEPGDIIVDGGNALFTDTIRREKAVRETGIHFVGAGISGGEEARATSRAAPRSPTRPSARSSRRSPRSPRASPA